jgi:hypothetical protein
VEPFKRAVVNTLVELGGSASVANLGARLHWNKRLYGPLMELLEKCVARELVEVHLEKDGCVYSPVSSLYEGLFLGGSCGSCGCCSYHVVTLGKKASTCVSTTARPLSVETSPPPPTTAGDVGTMVCTVLRENGNVMSVANLGAKLRWKALRRVHGQLMDVLDTLVEQHRVRVERQANNHHIVTLLEKPPPPSESPKAVSITSPGSESPVVVDLEAAAARVLAHDLRARSADVVGPSTLRSPQVGHRHRDMGGVPTHSGLSLTPREDDDSPPPPMPSPPRTASKTPRRPGSKVRVLVCCLLSVIPSV